MPSSQPSTTELLVAALRPMGLQNSRGATKLDIVLSGFNKLADGLTAMRNETGAVAHGKDGFLDAIATDHARAFLHAGDAILGILLNAFDGKQPDLVATREPYESFPHLNEKIDRAVAVEVRVDDDGERPVVVFSVNAGSLGGAIELRVEPSRLLYGIDREAYVEVLRAADLPIEEHEAAADESAITAGEPVDLTSADVGTLKGPVAEVVEAYSGALATLRPGVEAFLVTEGLDPNAAAASSGGKLIDSLLATSDENMALDWKQRETIQAKLKVACKRVLVRLGQTAEVADRVAERFVGWLRVQAP